MNNLKNLVKKNNVKASDNVLQIMRTQGCSSCCSMMDGGNVKQQ